MGPCCSVEPVGRIAQSCAPEPDGQGVEQLVVALEGGRFPVPRPVRFEDDLRHAAIVGPGGGDAFGPARGAAVQQHNVGVLRVAIAAVRLLALA
jgi:hypothetical protein